MGLNQNILQTRRAFLTHYISYFTSKVHQKWCSEDWVHLLGKKPKPYSLFMYFSVVAPYYRMILFDIPSYIHLEAINRGPPLIFLLPFWLFTSLLPVFSWKANPFLLVWGASPLCLPPVLSVAGDRGCQPSWWGGPVARLWPRCSLPFPPSQGSLKCRARSSSAASGRSFPHLPTVRREHQCLFSFLNPGRRGILGAGCGDPAMYQWKEKKVEIVGSDFNSSGFSFF